MSAEEFTVHYDDGRKPVFERFDTHEAALPRGHPPARSFRNHFGGPR